MSLQSIMEDIKMGRRTQFSPLVQIPAARLVPGVYVEVELPQTCSKLWFPQTVVQNDTLLMNPAGLCIGVKINLRGAPTLAWGRNSNLISEFVGPVDRIFVTLLGGAAADCYFYAVRDVDVTYSGNLAGAGTPDNSTTTGGNND